MRLNSKGQVTIPAELRAQYSLHEGDEVSVVDDGGTLRIVRTEGSATHAQRSVRRLRSSATNTEFSGWRTDEIMTLLRGDDDA